MLGGFVLTAMFEPDDCVPSEGHEVAKQKAIGRFDFVLVAFCFLRVARPDGVTSKRKRHILSAPVVAAAPFLGARTLRLGRLAVIEKEAWVAFKRVEDGTVRENPRCPYQMPGP